MASRARLRRKAQAIAGAEYVPQRRTVKRDARQQVGSLASEGRALQQSLGAATRAVRRTPGLTGRDRATAIKDLAYRRADVGGSIALQQSQVRQDAHQALVDLAQSEGSAVSGEFADLLNKRQEHRQGERDFRRHQQIENEASLQSHIDQAKWDAAHPEITGAGPGGRTPSQMRSDKQSQHAALFWAKHLYAEYKATEQGKRGRKAMKDSNGNPVATPKHDKEWAAFASIVAHQKGVDNAHHAVEAVDRLRGYITKHRRRNAGPFAPKLGKTLGTAGTR